MGKVKEHVKFAVKGGASAAGGARDKAVAAAAAAGGAAKKARGWGKHGTGSSSGWSGSLRAQLSTLGLLIRDIAPDGNCLFRALSDQLYGSEASHGLVRARVVDFMAANADDFAPFLLEDEDGTTDFAAYLAKMRGDGEWGGNLELQASSRALGINICVHQAGEPLWQIVNFPETKARWVHLAYRDGCHYDSVRLLDDDTTAPAKPISFAVASGAEAKGRGSSASGSGAVAVVQAPPRSEEEEGVQLLVRSLPPGAVPLVAGPARAAALERWATRAREVWKAMEGDVDAALEALLAEVKEEEAASYGGSGGSATAALLPPPAAAPAPAEDPSPPALPTPAAASDSPAAPSADAKPAALSAGAAKRAAARAARAAAAAGDAAAAAALPLRRNGPCRCGSGKAYRRCCQDVDAALKRREAAIAASGGPEAAAPAADADAAATVLAAVRI